MTCADPIAALLAFDHSRQEASTCLARPAADTVVLPWRRRGRLSSHAFVAAARTWCRAFGLV